MRNRIVQILGPVAIGVLLLSSHAANAQEAVVTGGASAAAAGTNQLLESKAEAAILDLIKKIGKGGLNEKKANELCSKGNLVGVLVSSVAKAITGIKVGGKGLSLRAGEGEACNIPAVAVVSEKVCMSKMSSLQSYPASFCHQNSVKVLKRIQGEETPDADKVMDKWIAEGGSKKAIASAIREFTSQVNVAIAPAGPKVSTREKITTGLKKAGAAIKGAFTKKPAEATDKK